MAHSFHDVDVLKRLAADAGVARGSMFRVLRLDFDSGMPDIRRSNASQLPTGIPTLFEVRASLETGFLTKQYKSSAYLAVLTESSLQSYGNC